MNISTIVIIAMITTLIIVVFMWSASKPDEIDTTRPDTYRLDPNADGSYELVLIRYNTDGWPRERTIEKSIASKEAAEIYIANLKRPSITFEVPS